MSNYEQLVKDLKQTYGKSTINLSELANELGQSIATVRRGVKNGKGIPKYRRVGGGVTRQAVVFPILDVARFLSQTEEVY